MKLKYTFFIIFLIAFFRFNTANAVDYYPELGLDPFYSSLNPAYVNEDFNNNDSLVDIIKKKKNEKSKKTKKEKKSQKNSEINAESEVNFSQETVNDEQIENETNNARSENINSTDKKLEEVNFENKDTDVVPAVSEKKALPGILPNGEEKKNSKSKQFVTPKYKDNAELARALDRDERKKERELEQAKTAENNKFSLKSFFLKKSKVKKENQSGENNPQIELSADYMEYFPDRYEVEAIGNARIEFKKDNTILKADKIVFNYDRNVLRAMENVYLISQDSTTEGDFIKLDLNKPNGWIQNPVTTSDDIKLSAKEAYLYSDRIEEYEGVAKILKNDTLKFGATSFASYVDQGNIFSKRMTDPGNELESGVYSLKAKTIYIDSKDDHEVITIKNADLYLKKFRLAKVPSAKIVTNKSHTSVETNMPEFGSTSMLGAHIGPAVVLNVPGGSTLKLAPIITYDKEKLGIGGIARFRNEYNMTELAYGTSRDELLLRGRHKLAPGLMLNYSRLTNLSEWFLGYRRPKYAGSLEYTRNDYIKDLRLNFSQMFSAGAFVDDRKNKSFSDAEGRFRWMTQTHKSLYSYSNEEGNIHFGLGLVAQTLAGAYTSGEVNGLVRVGPSLATRVGPWQQSLIYYQSAIAGKSPFVFDRYRYGHSNVVLIESLKINKYLSVGYLASLAMNRQVKSDDLFQENRILLSIGPDYAKLTIGYDSFRRNTMFLLSMLVGTKDSDIEFHKSVIKNPDKFGKENNSSKKKKKKNYKKYLKKDVKV